MPSVLNDELWKVPATPDDVVEATSYLLTFADLQSKTKTSDQEKQVMTRAIAGRGYTRAELMLAMKEYPFDPKASHNFGRGMNLADIERIVENSRVVRRRLKQSLTAQQRDELVAGCGEIGGDDFRCCGFDGNNNPLWRYAPNVPPSRTTPTPQLPDKTADRTGSGTGIVKLGDVL